MSFPRSSGILLHPTSFPSRFGIGDLGNEAYRFIDFLKDSSQHYWQILPLGPTGFGNSPYMCYSALAGNPLLISPEKLRDRGLLSDDDFANLPEFPLDNVDYQQVESTKIPLLKKACSNFKANITQEQQQAFEEFSSSKAYWLDDYSLFMALKHSTNGASWNSWDEDIAKRKPEAIEKAKKELEDEVFYHKFLQFEFHNQWSDLRQYANECGVKIIGDIPIYVAHDSADVWGNPENFCLDKETGEAALMAGVPPDYFSATGQLWGNPVYDWKQLEKQNFKWWVKRFEAMLDYVDIIRIDHFRGFESFWAVPLGEETAENGEWIEAPGDKLFEAIKKQLGTLPVLAEDLGTITPEVEALRDKFEFPGMKVLLFAFGGDASNPYLPFNVQENNCVIYTGTHDNNTTVGWYESATDDEKRNLSFYLGSISPDGVHWDMIRLAMASVANVAIFPLQDILGLGANARMNIPSKGEGNWEWRYRHEAMNSELSQRMKYFVEFFGRSPIKS
ncbi:4-alpha-glucanotransferase [Rivularia sp. UHCC 0363]|uniref:4-alpha-glucanotransferase n=1 Tax=Rivularia sp. UHCC 0363 TaxID=3110244 RepID=UPI002B214218|nr:4-alpha-glucanotransferase [Rivularia sp. UHCC 0363]MEA5593598.1 4-alpha-glucanotransferase [Rivularia sp. UHCC 0363]